MNCEQARILLMGYLDGELDSEQEKELRRHLDTCPACRAEWESFKNLKEDTSNMKFKLLPEMYWDEYWEKVYNKIERGLGWIFFSIGAIILFGFGFYEMFRDFFMNPKEPLALKLGVGFLSIGLIVIFVSVLREKLMVRRVDKYRRVIR
ncbi:MAG: zf-HC2 domain-containing protein [Calditrichaeota bacterium]|nr:zf-HC2 domain-containing protein [Calditrichota bacterium]